MNRGDIKALFIYNPSTCKMPDILHKKRWSTTPCKSSRQLIHYLEQLQKKDACILIHLPIAEDVIKLIKDIRNISLLPSIIIIEKRTFYEKARSFIKEGACYYIGGAQSKNKFNEKLWYVRETLLYPKKWLETFYEDNVWSRNSLQALNHLIGAKLQTQLIQRLTHLKQHLETPTFPIDFLALKEKSISPLKKQLKKVPLISNLSKKELNSFLEKSTCHHFLDAISVSEYHLEETVKSYQQAIVLYSLKQTKNIDETWALSYSHVRFISLCQEESIPLLLDSIRGGFVNICQKDKPETFKDSLFEAWQSMSWPYFHNKVKLNELSYTQRLYFLDYLLRKRKQEKQLYEIDILTLFPELTSLFNKQSTATKAKELLLSHS